MLTALIILLVIALALCLYLLLRQQQREAEVAGLLEYAEGTAIRSEQ